MKTIIKFYIKKYIYKKLDEMETQKNNEPSTNAILEDWVNSSKIEF